MNVTNEGEDLNYIKVGKQLGNEEVNDMKYLVRYFYNVFAWLYDDFGNEIPIEIASHSIPLIFEAKPVKRKKNNQ